MITDYVNRPNEEIFDVTVRKRGYLSLIGPLRSGKTTFLMRKLAEWKQRQNYLMIYVPLLSHSEQTDSAKWYELFHKALVVAADGHIRKPAFYATDQVEWGNAIRTALKSEFSGSVMVIILDNVEALPANIRVSFLSMLRSIHESRPLYPEYKRLLFIFSGSFIPHVLIDNDAISPFRVSEKLFWKDVTRQEAKKLLRPLYQTGKPVPPEVFDAIYRWTEGDVCQITRIVEDLITYCDEYNAAAVDRVVKEHIVKNSNFFHNVVENLQQNARAMDIVHQIAVGDQIGFSNTHPRSIAEAWLAGVIKGSESSDSPLCVLRNPIYRLALEPILKESPRPRQKNGQQPNTNFELLITPHRRLEALAEKVTRDILHLIQTDKMMHNLWLKEESTDSAVLKSRVLQELIDLFKQLFPAPVRRIELENVTKGFSRASVVRVQPTKDEGPRPAPVIAKIGYHLDIEYEEQHCQDFAEGFLRDFAHLQRGSKHTKILSGIRYELIGAFDRAKDFEGIFQDAESYPTEYMEKIIDDLFINCRTWYNNFNDVQDYDFAEQYAKFLHCSPDRLTQGPNAPYYHVINNHDLSPRWIRIIPDGNLYFPTVEQSFPDPIKLLVDGNANPPRWKKTEHSARLCITHGDLNANNIMINLDIGRTCLIDFYRTGYHHALRDFIQLESVIKFILLGDFVTCSLSDRYNMERLLLEQDMACEIDNILAKGKRTLSASVQRAFRLICRIRQKARDLVMGVPAFDSFLPYHAGMLFHALATIRFVRTPDNLNGLEEEKALHALLVAAMTCQKIKGDFDW